MEHIIIKVGQKFRTFGGGQDSETNPIAAALKDEALQFAAGVDVADVVRFVLNESGHTKLLEACEVAVLALTHKPINPKDIEFIKTAIADAERD